MLLLVFLSSSLFAESLSGIELSINNFNMRIKTIRYEDDFRIGTYLDLLGIIKENYNKVSGINHSLIMYVFDDRLDLEIRSNSSQENQELYHFNYYSDFIDFFVKKYDLKQNDSFDSLILYGVGFFSQEESDNNFNPYSEIKIGAFTSNMIEVINNTSFVMCYFFNSDSRESFIGKTKENRYLIQNLEIFEDSIISVY